MQAALNIDDIREWNSNYKIKNRTYSVYSPTEEAKMHGCFHCLVDYYFYKENCRIALNKLKPIVKRDNFLRADEIKSWLAFHEWLGSKKLNSFLDEYDANFENSVLEIAGMDLFIELSPFIPVVVFCEVFKILYLELELHLDETAREKKIKEWLTKAFVH